MRSTLTFIVTSTLACVHHTYASTTYKETYEPCAEVAAVIAEQEAPPYQVDGNLALECLRSVPLDEENDLDTLVALRSVLTFQSTLAYLKNPPPGSVNAGVDILGGMDDIIEKLKAGGYYENEYDLQFDVFQIGKSAKDFHVNTYLDIINVFSWQRADGLLSLSKDGVALPDLYLRSDVRAFTNSSLGYTPSSISKINGIDAETWVNDFAETDAHGHDDDANYNNVMWNPSIRSYSGSSQDRWTVTSFPQGNDTIIEFANKTIKHINTTAVTSQTFDNVTDGASFFERFCTGLVLEDPSDDNSTETSTSINNSTSPEPTLTVNPFEPIETDTSVGPLTTWFPEFLASTPDHSVAGYLPKEFPDLAVLQMPTFMPNETNNTVAIIWQNTVRGLLATAKDQNRTKLIVDVRGNGGGFVFLSYDLIRNLFPSILPYGGYNSRSTPLYQSMISIIDGYTAHNTSGNATIDATPFVQRYGEDIASTSFNDRNALTPDGKPWPSAQAFYGPVTNYGDNFSSVARANLALTSATAPIDVLGFGNNTAKVPQVFKPENVLLLTDGLCGSTCALFSEFLKAEAGVKSIAVGGRRQDGPMQAVGGSKGSEVLDLGVITLATQFASAVANGTANNTLTTQLADFHKGYETLALRAKKGTGSLRVNFKNQIRKGDDSRTPLQYVYEAADARFFYTPEMIFNQSLVWQMAYAIHWGNQSAVPGSVGHPSSLSGNLLSYIDAYPPQGANYTFGANATDFPTNITNAASTNHPTITPIPAASTGPTKFDVSTTYLGTAVKSSATSSSAAPTSSGSSAARRNSELGITTGGGALALMALLFM